MSPENNHLFQPPPSAAIAAELLAMQSRQEDEFQPARFSHMHRLLRRAERASAGVQQILLKKLMVLITEYKEDLTQAKNLHAQEPIAGQAQQHSPRQQRARHLLRTLRRDLSAPSLTELTVDSAQALDDEMHASEQAAQLSQLELPIKEDRTPAHRRELKAVRRYRQIAAQQKTESMVNRSLIARPQNPGPLNPHMLAIKSLTSMRDLSLPYLNRFVSYIETILWLEEEREAELKKAAATKKDKTTKKAAANKKPSKNSH